jgi:hypothetical protein
MATSQGGRDPDRARRRSAAAYIEGTCRPRRRRLNRGSPRPRCRDRREGLSPQARQHLLHLPEWYIVYSFEDFGRFLDRGSESQFNYLGHIFGFWRSFCTINRALPPHGVAHRGEDDDLRHRRQLFDRIRHQGTLREHDRPRLRMDQGRKRTPQDDYARTCCRTMPRFLYTVPWYKYPFRESSTA